MRHERHECDTSATQMLHERYECDRNEKFDNGTGENIFSHPYIYYIGNETQQGEEQFHSKNYLLEIPRFHAKMRLKRAPNN